MIESIERRFPPETLEQQSLEKSLRARGDFISLPKDVQSLARNVDKLEEPFLTLAQREAALTYICFMNNPKLENVAKVLGREVEEIKNQINQVLKGPEDEDLIEAISRLTNDGELELSSFRRPPEYLNSEFLEEVKGLREKGLGNETIAEELDVEPKHLQYAISLLIKSGEIKSRNRTRPTPR